MRTKLDLWMLNNYESDLINRNVRRGLRCRYDRGIEDSLKCVLKCFIDWVRLRFNFPIQVVMYLKASEYVKAKDGEMVWGTFFGPFEYTKKPYIKIACCVSNDYENKKRCTM